MFLLHVFVLTPSCAVYLSSSSTPTSDLLGRSRDYEEGFSEADNMKEVHVVVHSPSEEEEELRTADRRELCSALEELKTCAVASRLMAQGLQELVRLTEGRARLLAEEIPHPPSEPPPFLRLMERKLIEDLSESFYSFEDFYIHNSKNVIRHLHGALSQAKSQEGCMRLPSALVPVSWHLASDHAFFLGARLLASLRNPSPPAEDPSLALVFQLLRPESTSSCLSAGTTKEVLELVLLLLQRIHEKVHLFSNLMQEERDWARATFYKLQCDQLQGEDLEVEKEEGVVEGRIDEGEKEERSVSKYTRVTGV